MTTTSNMPKPLADRRFTWNTRALARGTSFAEAKAREQRVQKILNPRASGESVEGRPGEPEVLGNQDPVIGRTIQCLTCFAKQVRLASVQCDRAFVRKDGLGEIADE